jgi:hypothetical protein
LAGTDVLMVAIGMGLTSTFAETVLVTGTNGGPISGRQGFFFMTTDW